MRRETNIVTTMGGPSYSLRRSAFWLSALAAGCGSGARAPAAAQQPAPVARNAADPSAVLIKINQLEVDPAKSVRIRGVITSILGVRKVPAKVVFKIADSTEAITVVINKEVQLRQGAQVELIGRYKQIPSPTHKGAGEPPREAVFEVERFLDLH